MNLTLFFMVAAIVCLAVALLVAVGAFSGTDFDSWLAGGLLSWAISKVVP